jgi:leader peptidase (prepilin peptidase) / N-methyltransferase
MTRAMTPVFEIALAALGGAAIGSFLNVVIHRLPRRESISSGRSRCPGCGAQIAAYDNVPIFSWLVLKGRCRHCAAPISPRYPLIELLTAVAFAAVVAVRGADGDLLLELPFVATLIAVAGIDLEHRIVPNRILLPAAAWALAAGALVAAPELPEYVLAGAIAFLALLLAALAYPAGMGMGDVKLAGVMGLYLGLATAPALFAAFLVGSIAGIALIVQKGSRRDVGVPFAPFLALGGLIGLLAGPELIDLYSDRFLS